MLPNHSSCCLIGDGTARQSRRGSAHLSGVATFANPQTAASANLPYRKALTAAAFMCVAVAAPASAQTADPHSAVTRQCLAEAREADFGFGAFWEDDGWTYCCGSPQAELRFQRCLISNGFDIEPDGSST